MAYKLMITGTMSSAGKSFIVTGLCRLFSNLGYRVAPFKSQNMALNSGVTFDGFEMGRAQIVQAEAARCTPDVRMNPVLLKPNSDVGSQVIVSGKSIGNMKARDYYNYKTELIPLIKDAFEALEKEYDVIIIEGAGSPAEINLKDNDIVNMGLAKMIDAPVLLVGDIDLGGVFAQLLGTLEWLSDEEKDRIKGMIINKFRGDASLLLPGIKMLEERTNKEVVGVVPYSNVHIDEEDSVTKKLGKNFSDKISCNTYGDFLCNTSYNASGNALDSASDSTSDRALAGAGEDDINIYVIRLPHLSNFTDFTPLEEVGCVSVSYISEIPEDKPDMLILPGTKSTISDLIWLKKKGFDSYIMDIVNDVPVMGICGGYQMLGTSISDPYGIEIDIENDIKNDIKNKNAINKINGLGLLNTETVIEAEKTLTKVKGKIECESGFFACLNNKEYEGYEIHCGVTDVVYDEKNNVQNAEFNSSENVFGTYIHGIFDRGEITETLINALRKRREMPPLDSPFEDYKDIKDREYDALADVLQASLDMARIFEIMGIEK